jgi:hypothetical protein
MIRTPDAVVVALAELARLSRADLCERWQVEFGHPPPPRVHRSLLAGALAWQLQIRAHSGWTPAKIRKMLDQASGGKLITQPGTRLVREWQGRHYQVTVLASGFDYDGRIYNSLTAIAREITGISWSGPRFFGLKS